MRKGWRQHARSLPRKALLQGQGTKLLWPPLGHLLQRRLQGTYVSCWLPSKDVEGPSNCPKEVSSFPSAVVEAAGVPSVGGGDQGDKGTRQDNSTCLPVVALPGLSDRVPANLQGSPPRADGALPSAEWGRRALRPHAAIRGTAVAALETSAWTLPAKAFVSENKPPPESQQCCLPHTYDN